MRIALGADLGGPEYGSNDFGEEANAIFAKYGMTFPKSETGSERAVSQEFSKISSIFGDIRSENENVGSINPLFFFPGSLVPRIPFAQPRTGKFSKAARMLMIQIPVPKSMIDPDKIGPFIFEQLREILPMAQMVFKKAKIPFDVAGARALIDQAEKIYNAGDYQITPSRPKVQPYIHSKEDSENWTKGPKQFFTACGAGKAEAVLGFLSQGVSPAVRDEYGLTGLIWAGRKGRIESAAALLDKGAEIDAKDKTGRTALFHAVCFNRLDFVAFMADKGANLNPVDMHGCTPLDLAQSKGNKKMEKLLGQLGAETNLHRGND